MATEIHVHEAPADAALSSRIEQLEKLMEQVVSVVNQLNGALGQLTPRVETLENPPDPKRSKK